MTGARIHWPGESLVFLPVAALALLAGMAGSSGLLPDLAPGLVIWSLAVAVVIAGLPHGALDPLIAHRAGLYRSRWGLVLFSLAYAGIALVVIGLWIILPGAGLAVFLAVSAWHFSGDWRTALPGWGRVLAGIGLIGLPVFAWPERAGEIFTVLSGPAGGKIASLLSGAGPAIGAGLTASAIIALRRNGRAAAEIAALGALAFAVPPLVYFTIYFALLHSPRHLRGRFAGAGPRRRRRLFLFAGGFTGLTVLAAALAWWLLPAMPAETGLLRLVFIGLAALTVPHMMLIGYAAWRDQSRSRSLRSANRRPNASASSPDNRSLRSGKTSVSSSSS